MQPYPQPVTGNKTWRRSSMRPTTGVVQFARLALFSARSVVLLGLILLWPLSPVFGAKTVDFDSATIADLNAAFKAGTLTSEKLVQLCLARIQTYDREGPALHAVMA